MKPKDRVRTRHDEWVKRALSLWLHELGDVEIDARIAGQSRRGDVLFAERRDRPAHRRKLGTLGKLARGEVLFEAFRNPLTEPDLKGCVLKAIDLEAREAREARRAGRKRSSVVVPALCVITPSMSNAYAVAMGIKPMGARSRGLYSLLGPSWRTAVVVANELPESRATLWLRLLGRGGVQGRAMQELERMSEREPLRDATLALLIAWQDALPPPAQQSEEERELTMNLERIYERWEQKTLDRGRREGTAKGRAQTVLDVLEGRGLAVTAAQRKQVLACTDQAQLRAWSRMAGTTPSVKALLAGGAPPRVAERRP